MTVLGLVGLVLAWLQPMHILPWVGWHSEFLAFCSVLLLSFGVLCRSRKHVNTVPVPQTALFVALLIPVVIIQHVFGLVLFLGDALVIALYAGTGFWAVLAGHSAIETERRHGPSKARVSFLEWVAVCTLTAAAASVILAFTQALDVWNSADWINRTGSYRRPGANFGQPNHLATLLLLGAASLLFLYRVRRVTHLFSLFTLGYLALGLALTESRTGIVGATLLTVWWLAYPNIKVTRPSVLAVAAVWFVLLVFVFVWPRWVEEFHSPNIVSSVSASINLSAGSRLQIWSQLFEAALQKPWFGWGLREVSQAHNAVLHEYAKSEPFTYAHNIVLDALIGLGIPITLIVSGLVLKWGWVRLRSVKNAATWYCVAFILPVTVHSCLEFPFAYAYFLFPVLMLVGILEAECAICRPKSWPLWALAAGFVLTVITALWMVVEYVAAEEDFRVARFEAIRLGKTQVDYERPHLVLLTQMQTMLDGSRVVPEAGMPPQTIAMLRSAALRFPWTALQNRYALSLALNGQPEEAARQLKVMRAMHGERAYVAIKAAWIELANTKHPQLLQFEMP